MTILFLRVFFLILSFITGHYIGLVMSDFNSQSALIGAVFGGVGGIILVLVEILMRHFSIRNLSAAVFGLVFGFFMAWLLSSVLRLIPMDPALFTSLQIVFMLVFCYLGTAIAIRGKDEFNLIVPYVRFVRQDQKADIIILDTSVIIDGRIADICQTNFVEGHLIVPIFVLRELQHIADSEDPLKRTKGRRGLDILNRIQKTKSLDIRIHKEDFLELKEVDAKLVRLAQILNAKILTTDFNLNKIAEIQGIKVLNINDLANAIKPVFLPGEEIDVKITKEGKEYNQGVAYLDDGTMVVVDNSKHLIGQTIGVVVTSVLQTSAGRMIFAEKSDSGRDQRRHR